MDLIFASTHKFSCDAVKSLCVSSNLSCYTLCDDSELDFILEDLVPHLVIVTEDFFYQFEDKLVEHLEKIESHNILCSDNKAFYPIFADVWSKDIDMFHLQDNLKQTLARIKNG